MKPVGVGTHIHVWQRTPQLRDYLKQLQPDCEVTAGNILTDGATYHLEQRETPDDYPGHAKAIKKLLKVASEAGSVRGGHYIQGLIDLTNDLPPDLVGVEVGCYAGESTQIILDSGKFASLTCVDTWESWAAQAEKVFDKRVGDRVTKLKAASARAAQEFPDGSLDFVYIDAAHDLASVTADITAWRPKIRPGGILAGHDIHLYGVKTAVARLLGTPDKTYADSSWLKTQ